jgi:hypothetical protein
VNLLQGNSMYAEIPEQEVEAKSPLVEEDGIYVIGRFRVLNAKSGYRPVNAQFMVEFTLHTTIMVEFYDRCVSKRAIHLHVQRMQRFLYFCIVQLPESET